MRSRACYPRIADDRLPVILLGNSNEAQGFNVADDADPSVRRFQTSGAEWAYRNYCHQGHGDTTYWAINDNVGPMGPMPSGSGVLRTHYMLDLGLALANDGILATVLSFAVGSSTFDNYSPSLNPSAYATRLQWIKNGLAQMPQHKQPILVTGQGMASEGTYLFDVAQAELMTALRADLGYPTMKVCVIRAPFTAGYTHFNEYSGLIGRQNSYVAGEPLSTLAYNDTMTFVDDTSNIGGQIHGVHFDAPSGRKLAIGPDDATTRSLITAIRQLM